MGFFSNRRNKIIEKHLFTMVRSGNLSVHLDDLFFEAAARYAQDNGGKLYDDMRDSIVFDSIINGENYSVFFMAGRGGRGVDVTLTKRRSASELVSEHVDAVVNRVRAEDKIREIRQCVLESLSTRKTVRRRPTTASSINLLFEEYATAVPSKWEASEDYLIRFGFVDVPRTGILIVFAALIDDEAIILVPGQLPSKPGMSQAESLLSTQDDLREFQEEGFPAYRSAIQAEVAKRGKVSP